MSVLDLTMILEKTEKHFTLCPVCNVYIDYRDLGKVFDHMHDPNLQNALLIRSFDLSSPQGFLAFFFLNFPGEKG
jgi:hypothetical protein